jgi:hypothetical protein
MNRSARSCALLAAIAGIVSAALAQHSVTLNDPARPRMEVFGDQQSLHTAGKPFVATWIITTTQKRTDGANLAPLASLLRIARDSSGKVYSEQQNLQQDGTPSRSFSVDDPVSGTRYTWLERTKDVFVFHYEGVNSRAAQERLRKLPWTKELWTVPLCVTSGSESAYDRDEFSIQNLGTGQILGIDAQGILASRNDAPVTEERWYSPDLQIALTTRVNDSRAGTSIMELKSLEQVEPDPILFRIPAGYEMVNSPLPHGENR